MSSQSGGDAEPGNQFGGDHRRECCGKGMGERGQGIREAGFVFFRQHDTERECAGGPQQQPAGHGQDAVGEPAGAS